MSHNNTMPPPPPWFVPEPPAPELPPYNVTEAQVVEPEEEQTLDEQVSLIFRTTLTKRHQIDGAILKFILEYVSCRHIPQASKHAGITTREGKNLLTHKDVYEAIRKITELSAVKYGYDGESLAERMKEIVDFDPIELYREDGSFKRLEEMEPAVRRTFKKFKLRNIFEEDPNGMKTGKIIGETLEVEIHDKIKPTELLSREKNMFKDTKVLQHDVSDNMANTLLGGVRRAESRMIEMAKDVSPQGGNGEVQNVWSEKGRP